jgi:ankyrin repeat protein
MDKLLEVQESEVRIEFELRTKCRTTINLRNLMHTMHVAFKVQTTSPEKFSVKPPNGFIPPLGEYSFDVILMPQEQLPDVFPRSNDKFLVKSAMAPGGSIAERVPPEWFASRKKHMFLDAKLTVVYMGPFLLRHLVAKGDTNNVQYLIEGQSSCNKGDENGRTALHIAAASGNVEMVNLLLQNGAVVDVMSSSGQTALLEAVYMGHYDIADALLQRGANTEAQNPRGWTAVHLAASWNHADILKLLIEKRAHLDARDSEGRTALHSAVTEGHVECVKLLLQAGVDVDARSEDGRTAVYRAAAKDDSLLVELLLEWGANKSIKTAEGKTPFDIAVEKGHVRPQTQSSFLPLSI